MIQVTILPRVTIRLDRDYYTITEIHAVVAGSFRLDENKIFTKRGRKSKKIYDNLFEVLDLSEAQIMVQSKSDGSVTKCLSFAKINYIPFVNDEILKLKFTKGFWSNPKMTIFEPIICDEIESYRIVNIENFRLEEFDEEVINLKYGGGGWCMDWVDEKSQPESNYSNELDIEKVEFVMDSKDSITSSRTRVCVFDPPSPSNELNTSLMMTFSGGDSIRARAFSRYPSPPDPESKRPIVRVL